MMNLYRKLLFIILGISCSVMTLAQNDSIVNLKNIDRISFKTNSIDWALLIANIGLEYDLSGSPYGKYTFGMNFRYSGGASTSFVPKYDFKLFDVRCELRRYWRQSMTVKKGRKKGPKVWRAYYWGAYAGYTTYTIWVPNGFKGKGINVGGAFGYEKPLLKFKNGSLDMDLGVNIGFSYQQYEKSKMIEEERMIVKNQDWKLFPYPMISEIRVGLVYRFKSIREKYVKNKH